MAADFTPGPWRVGFGDGTCLHHIMAGDHSDGDGMVVVVSGGTDDYGIQHGVRRIEDARLIAAAPELLEALREALGFIADQEDVRDGDDGHQLPNEAMVLAGTLRAVIAKATGP